MARARYSAGGGRACRSLHQEGPGGAREKEVAWRALPGSLRARWRPIRGVFLAYSADFFIDPIQLAARQRKVEKEKEQL
jgi:hypothetical protein